MAALQANHDSPIKDHTATFGYCVDKVLPEKLEALSASSRRKWERSAELCEPIKNTAISELRLIDLERLSRSLAPSTANELRTFLVFVFDYANQHDLVSKNYAEFLPQQKPRKRLERKLVTMSDVVAIEDRMVRDYVLVMIYTGLRPSEALAINPANVDGYFLRNVGAKTEAGKHRTIPIHPAIRPILCGISAKPFRYEYSYMTRKAQGIHLHDCRHTFSTMAEQSGLNRVAIDKIMGHAGSRMAEKVYMHLTDDFLMEEMLKYKWE